jgi:hypothetical protein
VLDVYFDEMLESAEHMNAAGTAVSDPAQAVCCANLALRPAQVRLRRLAVVVHNDVLKQLPHQ